MIPLLRTDRTAATALTLRDFAVAAGLGMGLPVALGLFGFVYDWMVLRQGGEMGPVGRAAVMLVVSPVISWAAILPFLLWLRALLALGFGGLVPALLSGGLAGLVLGLALIPQAPEFAVLPASLGVGLAAAVWFSLSRRRPGAVVRPGLVNLS